MSDPKTFIEIWYEDDETRENWFATRQVCTFKPWSEEETLELLGSSWRVGGSNLTIYDRSDIQALRLLLDEIEKEYSGNHGG